MRPSPCPLCGYDAPGFACPHCGGASKEGRFGASGALRGIGDGIAATGKGFVLLATTPGVKRFLVPPLVLTLALFTAVFAWAWSWIERFFEAVRLSDASSLGIRWEWLASAVEWLIERGVVIWTAKAGATIVFLVSSTFVALWTFSIAYEAISGPFLDEIQGRIEKRWFGRDPRDAIHRPSDIPGSRCAWISAIAGAVGVVAILAWWLLDASALVLLAVPLAFVAAGLVDRDYGKWLWWVVRLETHTTWVSVKASALAGALMLLFFWLKFVPVIGYFLFAGLAGFATSISLLDIPFSRRQWTLGQRLAFMARYPLPTIALGVVSSLLFLIPFLGPLIAVPSASIGGLWLVCRLDKNPMRPADRRIPPLGRPRPAA